MLTIETAGYEDVVVLRDLQVRSRCRCHQLPVDAAVHVGYLPSERLVAAGDLADELATLGRDEWLQPEAAAQVAEWVVAATAARGVAVVVESRFACAAGRDAPDARAALVTTTTRGALRDDPTRRREFLAALNRAR